MCSTVSTAKLKNYPSSKTITKNKSISRNTKRRFSEMLNSLQNCLTLRFWRKELQNIAFHSYWLLSSSNISSLKKIKKPSLLIMIITSKHWLNSSRISEKDTKRLTMRREKRSQAHTHSCKRLLNRLLISASSHLSNKQQDSSKSSQAMNTLDFLQ